MVEHLRLRWRDDLSMAALLGLRDELDDMLGRIRSTRHISNPVFKCPVCGHIGRGADPQYSTILRGSAGLPLAPRTGGHPEWTASPLSNGGGGMRTENPTLALF